MYNISMKVEPQTTSIISKKQIEKSSPKSQEVFSGDKVELTEVDKRKMARQMSDQKIAEKLDVQNETLKNLLDRMNDISVGLNGRKVYFISGFDWFGASSVKGNYDGLRDMHEAIEGSSHYAWDQKEDVIKDILKQKKETKIALIGHSFGGDTAVEIANELNKINNKFKSVDLLVTLDSVGLNNDMIPKNVTKNLNYIASGNALINDGPNMARDFKSTKVDNFLMDHAHAALDDLEEVQKVILDEIDNIS